MRPYFAIILDSFRRAFASRILYLLLGLILLLLVALAPLHIRETLDWKLQTMQHVDNPAKLVEQLVERGRDGGHPGAARIWSQLPDQARQKAEAIWDELQSDDGAEPPPQTGNRRRRGDMNEYFSIVGDLNTLILDPDLYRAEDWELTQLDSEARALIQEGVATLDEEKSRRLNRLLVAEALPAIKSAAPSTLEVYYGPFTMPSWSFSATREQAATVTSDLMTYVFDKFVLSLGLLIGILVTANIIPETFEPGSLNLLLSKPISRWALYVTKFFGGCILIALCSVLLFVGLWLWMGYAVGVWDSALLWSIPLYILVFAIYYSVSAFIGLTYRSSIMAVVVTGVFWAVCFGLGTGYGFLNARVQNERLYDPAVSANGVWAMDGVGNLVAWDSQANAWPVAVQPTVGTGDPGQDIAMGFVVWVDKVKEEPWRLPPVVSSSGRVYAGVNFLLDIPGRSRQEFHTLAPGETEFERFGRFPNDAIAMFPVPDGLLIADRGGQFHFLDENRLEESLAAATPEQRTGDGAAELTEPRGPDQPVRISETYSVDCNASNQEVAVHQYESGQHRIVVFRKDGDQYQQARSVQFDIGTKSRVKCFVAYQGNTIVVVAGNGQVVTFDAQTLEEQQGYRPESHYGIETIAASPDGRWFAMMYANQRVWLLDTEQPEEMVRPGVTGQGSISSISFDGDNQLCVVDRQDRLSVYQPETMSREQTYSASGGWIKNAYRYVVKPMYLAFPKPGEFYKLVQHLSDTRNVDRNSDVDLIGAEVPPNPYSPLWSGLGFMTVMLVLSCLIFQYRDY